MIIVSCDLAKSSDYTAISIVEQVPQKRFYRLKSLIRPRLGTSYMAIADKLNQIISRSELRTDGLKPLLVIDGTGVGAAVEDILRSGGMNPVSIKIHGGKEIHWRGLEIGVPKKDLVISLLSVFNQGRLQIPREIPEKDMILEELQKFKVRINPRTRRATFSGDGAHDDIILSLAMGIFAGEKIL